jgi:dihydropteroate synthase
MAEAGADIIDVGGESTRPAGADYGEGYGPVSAEAEVRRVLPVVERLVKDHGIEVSIDTTKAEVAAAALDAGASIVNDVSGGSSDGLLDAVAARGAELVLMHNRDRGQTLSANTAYEDVVEDVLAELLERVERACLAGVPRAKIWIDPGIGFAKDASQSIRLLAHTRAFVDTGHPVLVGPSRKSFISAVAERRGFGAPTPRERLGGTAAAVTLAVVAGAAGVRVHDVAEMAQAVWVAEASR